MASEPSVTLKSRPPFRAEHLGSLLRPENLLNLRDDVDNGTADKKQLTKVEDDAVKKIVQMQLDLGFHAITDGEYRRHSMSLASSLSILFAIAADSSAQYSVLGDVLPWS